MKSKHIYQALKFLYDNRDNERITEEVFGSAITDIHPIEFDELRNGLFLMGFMAKESSYHEWKITDKGIEYLINNQYRVADSINWIKLATIWSAIFGGIAVLIGLAQLYVSTTNESTPSEKKETYKTETQHPEKHTLPDKSGTNLEKPSTFQ